MKLSYSLTYKSLGQALRKAVLNPQRKNKSNTRNSPDFDQSKKYQFDELRPQSRETLR